MTSAGQNAYEMHYFVPLGHVLMAVDDGVPYTGTNPKSSASPMPGALT